MANSLTGHIYMYRLRPTDVELRAYPIDYYETRTREGAAIIAMIMNNLDARVAQYPHELGRRSLIYVCCASTDAYSFVCAVTYGGNGQVFSNWAQFRLVVKYLAEMTHEQTLVLYSGHPLGTRETN